MIYLIFGKATFLSKKKLKEIIEERKNFLKENLIVCEFFGRDFDFSDFKREILSDSLFGQKKLILLKSAFLNQKFKEEFLKEGKKLIKEDQILIFFEEDGVRRDDPLFKFIKKEGQIYEFKPPKKSEVRKTIQQELLKNHYKIEPPALEMLIDFIGNDLWRLFSELKKLMAYKDKEKLIKKEDISLLIRPKIDINIFKTIDAIAQKDKKAALNFIYQHLKKGDSPLYLLTMISFQFRNLLMIKEKEETLGENVSPAQLKQIFKEIHPFVIEKSFRQAKKFSLDRLKKIYRKIFQIDLAIKTGKLQPEEGLELLILDL
jgi:DNA polymerase-3 subunit delta